MAFRSGQSSSRLLGLLFAGAYVVVGGLLGTVLLISHGNQATISTTATATATASTTTAASTTSWRTSVTTRTSSRPSWMTSSSSVSVASYHQVSGPLGLTTVIPDGWRTNTISEGYQADDPASPGSTGRFVRYEARRAPTADLYAGRVNYEASDWLGKPNGYQRLQLSPGIFHGNPSIRWEFEYDAALQGTSTQRRHVEIFYWQADNTLYDVYASAPAQEWTAMTFVLNNMEAAANP